MNDAEPCPRPAGVTALALVPYPKCAKERTRRMTSRTQIDDLNYALGELDELEHPPAEWLDEGIRAVRADVAAIASELLRQMIFRAGLPLPQLAEHADGALRIWWLGSGEQLTISVGADRVRIEGTRASDDIVFRHDVDPSHIAQASTEIDQARAFLDGMQGGAILAW